MLKIAGAGLVAAMLAFILRECGSRSAKLVSSVGIVVLLAASVGGIGRIVPSLGIPKLGSDAAEGCALMLKIVGAGYVFGTSADLCREIGENGVASALVVAGRVEIFLLILPVLREIITLGVEMLK